MDEKKNLYKNDLYYEEIDLFDLLRKIWKWKYLTIIIVLIFMILTFLYIRSAPLTYSSDSIIKIGKIANVMIEQIPDSQTYLKTGVFAESDKCAGIVSSTGIDTDNIKITGTSSSPDTSFSCVEKSTGSLIERHNIIYKKALGKINENIASIKTKEIINPVYFLESYTSPSSIIKKPAMAVKPDSKKTGIKLAVAFFASLFIGIFLSFFIEYILLHKK